MEPKEEDRKLLRNWVSASTSVLTLKLTFAPNTGTSIHAVEVGTGILGATAGIHRVCGRDFVFDNSPSNRNRNYHYENVFFVT
jgi:hypothetical protein